MIQTVVFESKRGLLPEPHLGFLLFISEDALPLTATVSPPLGDRQPMQRSLVTQTMSGNQNMFPVFQTPICCSSVGRQIISLYAELIHFGDQTGVWRQDMIK